jgi:hypothetical protein
MNSNSSYKKQEVITENWRMYSKEKKSINEKKQNLDEIQLPGMNLLVSFLLSLDKIAIILDKSAKTFNKPQLKIMADAARAFHPHFKKFYDEHPIITKIMLMGDIVGALKAKGMSAAIEATAKAIEAEEKSASTTSSEVQQPTVTPS